MKDRREDVQKIEDSLIRHHRSAAPADPPPLLAPRIVAHLREERDKRGGGLLDVAHVSRMVWRFTLAASLFAVLLGAVGMRLDVQTQVQFTEMMMDDAQGLEWAQEFGLL